ncbi:MAG: hypothetical protein ACJARX_002012 [Psychroserpens sp.]
MHRDLLSRNRDDLQQRIEKKFLVLNFYLGVKKKGIREKHFINPNGHHPLYANGLKKSLYVTPDVFLIKESIDIILTTCKSKDGGILPNAKKRDVCLNGMAFNYMIYFKVEAEKLQYVIDCLLNELMLDDGFKVRLIKLEVY